jgi:diadenosine tetraphosphate (Ap4A) HIT family hydrolase
VCEEPLVLASLRPPEASGHIYRGWAFVETRRHARGLADCTPDEAAALGRVGAAVAATLRAVLDAEHVYAWMLGDLVHHAHLHLVPRHRGTPADRRGFAVAEWPDAPQDDAAAVAALAARVRGALHR